MQHAVKFSPVRLVKASGSNKVVTKFQSHKMQREIRTESHHVEFPAAIGYEWDATILEYYPQPYRLKFEVTDGNGEVRTIDHTPDFLLIREDGVFLAEWKTEAHLQDLARRYPWRFQKNDDGSWSSPLIEKWLAEHGIGYLVCSADQIPRQRMANMLFLEDYMLPGAERCPVNVAQSIHAALQENPFLFLPELYDKTDCKPDDVFKLLADGELVGEVDTRAITDTLHFRVFRDTAVRAFEYARHAAGFNCKAVQEGVLTLEEGRPLRYHGEPYTIKLISPQSVALAGENRQLVEIQLHDLKALMASGAIQAESVSDPEHRRSRIGDFPERDLRIAIERRNRIENITEPTRTERRFIAAEARAERNGTDPLEALLPRTKDRGNRLPRLSDEQISAIEKIITEEFLTNRAPSMKHAHRKLITLCRSLNITAPSYPTFTDHCHAADRKKSDLQRFGHRVAYQNQPFMPVLDAHSSAHGSRPFETVHLDHTEMDIELISATTGKNLGRPWLSLAVDAYTRRILGFYLSFDAPSYRSNMMLMRDIVRRHQRLPSLVVVDGGRDFNCMDFDLFTQLFNIKVRYRPISKARHGSVLERLFGTAHVTYVHNLAGNSKVMKVVRSVTGKFLPANLAEWFLEALYYGLEYWAFEHYDQLEHQTLGLSPREAFERGMTQSGERKVRLISLNRSFLILSSPLAKRSGTRKVDRQRGVKMHGRLHYWCPDMADPTVAGKSVTVRYDPWDASTVYVEIKGQWMPAKCKALAMLGHKTTAELEALSAEYVRSHPSRQIDDVTAQQLAEFHRVFTPKGAIELAMERQQENRDLYGRLGISAIDPMVMTTTALPDTRGRYLKLANHDPPVFHAEPLKVAANFQTAIEPLDDQFDFPTF